MTGATNRALALAAVAALGALAVRARADLAPTSPFLPANATATLAGTSGPSGPIELRGIMATSDGTQYCIHDSAHKRDTWVGLNEPGHDFTVKTADPGADRISVEYQGRILRLDLHTAKVASSGTAGPPAITANPGIGANPSPMDEQKRLDAVAQEVRRRRMERERAAQDPQSPLQGAGR
jgi:hypothetical protein